MKNILLVLISALFITGTAFAQIITNKSVTPNPIPIPIHAIGAPLTITYDAPNRILVVRSPSGVAIAPYDISKQRAVRAALKSPSAANSRSVLNGTLVEKSPTLKLASPSSRLLLVVNNKAYSCRTHLSQQRATMRCRLVGQ